MNTKLQLTRYISKSAVAAGTIMTFDYLTGNNFSNNYIYKDALLAAGTVLSADVIKEIILSILSINSNEMYVKLIEPLLCMLIYSQGFEMFLTEFRRNNSTRYMNSNYVVGFFLGVVNEFASNPLTSLISGINIY
jgi:hypothetical protein